MEEKKETAIGLYGMGMDVKFIARATKTSVETVKQWLSQSATMTT